MTLPTFNPPKGPAEFPNKPEISIREATFGDGYTGASPAGLNHIRKVLSLTWSNLTLATSKTITDFLEARGGTESFWWTPPGESSPTKWTCKEWSDEPVMPTFKNVTATFRQSFALDYGVALPPWLPTGAACAIDFSQATIQRYLATNKFTRASMASYISVNGILQTAPIDTLRINYDTAGNKLGALLEAASTNSLLNSICSGAVAGTPGTMPTNWSVFGNSNGISTQVVGFGTEDGIPYVDVRFYGTPTAGSALGVYTGISAGAIPAAPNDVWSYSYCMRLVGGSLANLAFASWIWYQPGNGNFPSVAVVPTNAPLITQRNMITRTLTDAGTTGIFTQIRSNYSTGNPVDVTLRIGMPQLELGAVVTSQISTSGAAATRSADVEKVSPNDQRSSFDWYVRYDNDVEEKIATAIIGDLTVNPATLTRPNVKMIWAKDAA